jgi:ADP-ribose pyrophosphatase YjhB (NUDIX family)
MRTTSKPLRMDLEAWLSVTPDWKRYDKALARTILVSEHPGVPIVRSVDTRRWYAPGGNVERSKTGNTKKDETLLHAALRETREEIFHSRDEVRIEVLGHVLRLDYETSGGHRGVLDVVVARTPGKPEFATNPSENSDVALVTPKTLRNFDLDWKTLEAFRLFWGHGPSSRMESGRVLEMV